MRKLLTICGILLSLTASAQWQQTGAKVRYVTGIGIPTKDTAAGISADSSQILIRPADSSLYVKYKRTWLRVGGGAGGGSIGGTGTINTVAKFTASGFIGNSQIFDNGTKVGIGTTTPGYKLTYAFTQTTNTFEGFSISNDVSTGLNILYGKNTGGGLFGLANPFNGWMQYSQAAANSYVNDGGGYFSWHNSTSELMRITNSGNVGIGTTSPVSRLQVLGGALTVGGVNTYALSLGNSSGNDLSFGTDASYGYIQSWASKPLQINNQGNNTLLNVTSGNVGIGTTSPAAKLSVQGTTLINTNTDNGTDKLQVSGSASVSSFLGVGTSPSNTLHIKQTSPTFLIDDADNAGTASILFRPQNASFNTRGSIQLISKGAAQPTEFRISATDTFTIRSNSAEKLRIPPSGRVLLNTTTDNTVDQLQVSGNIYSSGEVKANTISSVSSCNFGASVSVSSLVSNNDISTLGISYRYVAKTATYTAINNDYLIDCTSGTFTVNLPTTPTISAGKVFVIKNSGTGVITVDPNGTQTVDGATTYSLSAQWATVQIMFDGTNWKIISKF